MAVTVTGVWLYTLRKIILNSTLMPYKNLPAFVERLCTTLFIVLLDPQLQSQPQPLLEV